MPISINGSGPVSGATTLNGLTIPTIGFGKVLQIVQGTKTGATTITTTTQTNTGLSATIVPSSVSSKILVMVVHNRIYKNPGADPAYNLNLYRDSTVIQSSNGGYTQNNNASDECRSMLILDSPSTTSSITYKTMINCVFTTSTGIYHENATMILVEIGP